MDLLAVALVGLIGSISIRGIKSEGLGNRSEQILEIMNLDSLSFASLIVILGWVSVVLFILKSLLSYLFTKRLFLFMSFQSIELSKRMLSFLTSRPLNELNVVSKQEHIFQLTQGTNALTLGILGTSFTILSDLALFILLIGMLLVIDTISAIAALLLFVFVGIKLNALYQEKSRVLGKQSKEKAVRVNEQISELLGLFREIVTRDTQNVYVNSIYSQRLSQANIAVAQKMIPLISKYTIDILIILLVVLVSTVQFYSNDSSRAVGNLALFLAASSRIAPAMLRTQQGYFQVKSNIGIGESTINLLNKISLVEKKDLSSKPSELISIPSWDGCPKIVFNKVSFRYDDLENWSLRNINLVIEPQTFVALVGPSGGGKSSLVDLLFGLLEPNAGEVLINGVPARQALSLYPGQFGYVPQTVELVQGTLLDNMALGLEKSEDFLKKTEKIVRLVGLGEFIEKLPQGLETKVGEKGLRLSGGQIQRLGIARALVNEPKILVLDESTSALDALSENSISSGLQTLRDKMTLIVIAHRLSTIRDADRVIYLDQGRIVAEGTFHELRQSLPDFDFQAKLMGL